MRTEYEQRPSGVGTVYFETELPDNAKRIYQYAVTQLSVDIDQTIYKNVTYNIRDRFRYPCLVAVEILKQYTDLILNSISSDYAFATQWFNFSSPLQGQSGQATLFIQRRNLEPFMIMDIAAHLYNDDDKPSVFGYDNIPLVVASSPDVAGDILSVIYTRTLGETVTMTPGRFYWFE